MELKDYTPNSNKYKTEQQVTKSTEPEKKVEKVVKGNVTVKKKSEIGKFFSKYIAEDVSNIKSYIISDVIIPTFKNTIWDTFTNSLEMILFGGTGRAKQSGGSSRPSYVSYDSKYKNRDNRSDNITSRNRFDFDDIVFTDRRDAEEVLRQMDALMDTYKLVTVADLYDLVGKTGEYTDQKYGWTNLRNANWVRSRDGYKLSLPKPLPID